MKIPKTFAEQLKTPEYTPGQRCADSNWVNHQWCERTTNWTCGECGRPVCATHVGWHAKPNSRPYGTIVCRRTTTQVRYRDGKWEWN